MSARKPYARIALMLSTAFGPQRPGQRVLPRRGRTHRAIFLIAASALASLLAACGKSWPTPTPVPPASPTAMFWATATPTSAPTATLAPVKPTATRSLLAPPDSQEPAAGICAEGEGAVVSVEINPDVPSPRCVQVNVGQRIRVLNRTDTAVELKLGYLSARVDPGAEYTFAPLAGAFLLPGVHVLHAAPYSGPEIWLVAK